ncbi:FadR/GntR family transcriptional regulator [Zafaria sp. J156]|uniref:FadR/GntR family transcriptional regulator n=1 Tax=Zafaria sp. J156 TaxID=3116490 RepID=UPI002E78D8BB|nr:FCD domain-containing protein [Zafaria sp. J156]MEE1621592.1 FCD domain-containing protein [Zafaria sp. J156]
MTTTPTRHVRLGAQQRLRALTSDIMELILERGLLPGDALPTEQELTAELGVGRNTLRESIKVLQALGVVEIRHGFGMFVANDNLSALADSLTFRGRMSLQHKGHEASELVEVRQALEAGLIGSAIDAATPEQLAALDAAVTEMERRAEAGENFVAADQEFHRLLFSCLENELLTNLLGVFWQVYRTIHDAVGTGAVADSDGGEDLRDTARIHRDILDAVTARDKPLASELMNRHFDGIRGRLAVFAGGA